MRIHDDQWCKTYDEPVLPNEEGNCSLCGAALYEAREFKIAGRRLFLLGQLVATPGALVSAKKYGVDLNQLLERHVSGDWGDLGDEDKEANEQALAHRVGRLFSAYGTGDSKVWIITEADRSSTTILRPDEY
jgi:hypothetical protein